MRTLPSPPGRVFQRLAAALVFSLAAAPALAQPDETSDPLMHLLGERGLLAEFAGAPAAEPEAPGTQPSLLRQVHERTSDLTVAAMNLLGVRYRRGGTSAESGFDCSGFTRHVFESSVGLVLPRRVDEQATAPGLVAVKRADLRPGDLVFFNTLKRTFSHVGIYIGDNRFIHSPRPGKNVRTEDMSFAYWAKRFTGARRADTIVTVASPNAAPVPAVGSGSD
jgi:cell wall-associated NlpC family hydrolase